MCVSRYLPRVTLMTQADANSGSILSMQGHSLASFATVYPSLVVLVYLLFFIGGDGRAIEIYSAMSVTSSECVTPLCGLQVAIDSDCI